MLSAELDELLVHPYSVQVCRLLRILLVGLNLIDIEISSCANTRRSFKP